MSAMESVENVLTQLVNGTAPRPGRADVALLTGMKTSATSTRQKWTKVGIIP
jgi:hypothetical protein